MKTKNKTLKIYIKDGSVYTKENIDINKLLIGLYNDEHELEYIGFTNSKIPILGENFDYSSVVKIEYNGKDYWIKQVKK